MAKFNHKDYARALRTLDSAPKEIEKAKDEYRATLAEIKKREDSRQWSPASIDNMKAEAKAKRDRTIKGLADSMIPAYNYVNDNNNYSGADFDLGDPKLQAAITLVNSLGRKVPFDTQTSLLNQFRGNLGALNVLEALFREKGLYMADMAHDLQRPISQEALENMAYSLNSYLYKYESKGIVDIDFERCFWTKNAFSDQAQRLGIDANDNDNVFICAIDVMKKGIEEDLFNHNISETDAAKAQKLQWQLDLAKEEINRAKANGEELIAAFNSAMKRVEEFRATIAVETVSEA